MLLRSFVKVGFMFMLVCSQAKAGGAIFFYDVVNVKENDTLSLREDAGVSYNLLAKIPANTKLLKGYSEKQVDGSTWVGIAYKKQFGWVNKYYLQLSDSLTCGGNEPFWGLHLKRGFLKFADPITEIDFKLAQVIESQTNTNHWMLVGNARGMPLSAALMKTESCSDDMSDINYPYTILLMFGGEVRSGCCNIQP